MRRGRSGSAPSHRAEDLVRGYAIDVFDEEKGRWFPLCLRMADAIFTGAEPDIVVPVTDEGWVSKPGLMGSADGTSPNERKAHESMVRWAGWSLVAPRPGKSVNPDEQAENVPNEVAGALKLTVDYEPEPGSLPALRYGREYRMRARMVDLAGNGSPFGSPTSLDFIHTLGPEKLGRFDPIPSPAMLFRSPKTEGESLERLVIRSNYNTPSPDTIAVDRHVAAPKTDQFMAELLGMFDGTGGGIPLSTT
ncbi:MAG TPA: hypothetical protein VEV82_05850 [Actinomycetota bacterium]|nr:hypothetical protein [Actinomycetota bacterium]